MLLLFVREVRHHSNFQHSKNSVHGCSNFMAHIRKKLTFCPASRFSLNLCRLQLVPCLYHFSDINYRHKDVHSLLGVLYSGALNTYVKVTLIGLNQANFTGFPLAVLQYVLKMKIEEVLVLRINEIGKLAVGTSCYFSAEHMFGRVVHILYKALFI